MTGIKPIPNHTLRDERIRHDWSQQGLVDKVGTTPNNVGRWERGEKKRLRWRLCPRRK